MQLVDCINNLDNLVLHTQGRRRQKVWQETAVATANSFISRLPV